MPGMYSYIMITAEQKWVERKSSCAPTYATTGSKERLRTRKALKDIVMAASISVVTVSDNEFSVRGQDLIRNRQLPKHSKIRSTVKSDKVGMIKEEHKV